MQAKISSFFKNHCDPPPPQLSDQIDGSKVDIFGRNDRAEVLVTYKRRDPKPNDSTSRVNGDVKKRIRSDKNDDDLTQSDIKENVRTDGSTAYTSSRPDSHRNVLNKKRTYCQFHLELGQSDFLLHNCSVCGLAYAPGEEGDEKFHKAFHRDYYQGIRFKGWRNERIVFKCDDNGDRIVLVLDGDPPPQKYKVQQIVKIMEKELGFADGMLLHTRCQVYLFISNRRIVGCLVAEPIKTGHRVILSAKPSEDSNGSCNTRTTAESPKKEDTIRKAKSPSTASLQFGNIKFRREIVRKDDSMSRLKANQLDDGAILCKEEALPAVCGVRALWVVPMSRRTRVASRLLDATRRSFCTKRELEHNQCAFSSPTSAGKAFASSYSGSRSFLIYRTQDV